MPSKCIISSDNNINGASSYVHLMQILDDVELKFNQDDSKDVQ